MAEVTERGEALASKLNPYIGTTRAIRETCSLICRHERTYHRIQEMWCNVEMSDRQTARIEKKEADLERRIRTLVESLPHTDEGPFSVKFDGDPRGGCVKIVLPGSLASQHDTWGRDGIDIP